MISPFRNWVVGTLPQCCLNGALSIRGSQSDLVVLRRCVALYYLPIPPSRCYPGSNEPIALPATTLEHIHTVSKLPIIITITTTTTTLHHD